MTGWSSRWCLNHSYLSCTEGVGGIIFLAGLLLILLGTRGGRTSSASGTDIMFMKEGSSLYSISMAESSLTSLSMSVLDSALLARSVSVSTNEPTPDYLSLSDPDKDSVVVLGDLLLEALSRSSSNSFSWNKSMKGPLDASLGMLPC